MNTKLLRDRANALEKIGSVPIAMVSAFVRMLREAASEIDRLYDQLEAIDAINENDWENGEAASWVCRIRNGEKLEDLVKDGMVTQDAHEASYFGKAEKST